MWRHETAVDQAERALALSGDPEQAVNAFLASRALAVRSQTLYRDTLLAMFREIGVSNVEHLSDAGLRAWEGSIKGRLAPGTAALRLTIARAFTDWLGGFSWRPVLPRLPQRLPLSLTPEEQDRVLGTIQGKSFRALRDRAIIYLLFGAGLRLSELCGLDLASLRPQGADLDIVVMGKGAKERILPLCGRVRQTLDAYLEARAKKHDFASAADAQAIFLMSEYAHAKRGRRPLVRISGRAVQYLFKKACATGDIAPRLSHVHCGRHSMAQALYRATSDLELVASALGHADLKTARLYARADTRHVREGIERLVLVKGKR